MKKRIILHIDMDYFFAQIEERENPQFKGKPIVVGADPRGGKGRGVVSTANYEARSFGIKSATPISRAFRLCPQAVFLPVNMDFYEKVSLSVFKIVSKKAKKVEKVSLDEAYLDLSDKCRSYKEAEKVGEEIKKEIYKKERLTCTVGIGENKMMAKIACELAKPDGLKVIKPSQTKKIIEEMPLETIPGIGPKTKEAIQKYLKKKNAKIKDARKIKKEKLIDLFGKRGDDFYHKLRGVDNSLVEGERKAKSVGKEHTFQKDTRDPEKIIKVFRRLVGDVYRQAKEEKIKGLVVVCRFEDFETHTKQASFEPGNYKEDFLYKKGVSLLLRFLTRSNKKIRLIGFRVSLPE